MPRTPKPFKTELTVDPADIAAIAAQPIDDLADDASDIDDSPPTPPEPMDAETAAVVQEQQRIEKAGFELLRRAARGHILNAPERLLLMRVAPAHIARLPVRFEQWLTKQIAGMRGIIAMQTTCGTPAQLAADAEALETARTRRTTEGSEIERRISELREQLAGMDSAIRTADAALTRRTTARDTLREQRLLPPYVQEEIRTVQASIRDDRVRAQNAKSALKVFHHLEHLDPGNKPADWQWILTTLTDWIEDVRVVDLVAPLIEPFVPTAGANPRRFCPDGWKKYLAYRRVEAEEAAETLQTIGDYDARIRAECDLLLSFWLPQDPATATAKE